MSKVGKVCAVAGLVALAGTVAPVTEAQPPNRIGATLAQTGGYASQGQAQLRGYQLCVKHTNDKGGVLGRKLELRVYDDGSDPATAVRLYEKLITQDKVDLVLGPFGGVTADPVADVTEKYRMPMVAPVAAPTFMYKKGRKFIFSMLAPGESILEGLIDLAAKKGLKTVAVVYEDDVGGRAVSQGAIELARKKGLQVVFADPFPPGTTALESTPVSSHALTATPTTRKMTRHDSSHDSERVS
jgi:branched-chain amino acid transport system substrate-binding protein